MTARELFEIVRGVFVFTGTPSWPCADRPDEQEMLVFRDELDSGHAEWVLARASLHDERAPELSDDDIPIDVALARALMGGFIRDYLIGRGWQVQAQVRRGRTAWRLVDCLSMAEGGGDRIDCDYPQGDDELEVLCQSVIAINHARGSK